MRAVEVESAFALVQAETLAGLVESLVEQLGEEALPLHSRAEVRIVVAAAAHLVHARHDVRGREREALLEPGPEDVLDLPGSLSSVYAAVVAPALADASRIDSSSESVRNGITGATFTLTGIPASLSRFTARSRRAGALARGSM